MDLDFLAPPTQIDYHAEGAKVRMAGTVVRNDLMNCWMAGGYDTVREIFSNSKSFTTEGTPVGEALGAEAMLVQGDDNHRRHRKVWAHSFTTHAVAARRDQLVAMATATLTPVIDRLTRGEQVDLVDAFKDYTTDVIVSQLDLSLDRRGDFQRWNKALSDAGSLHYPADHPKAVARAAARREVFELLDEEIAKREAMAPADRQPGHLIDLMLTAEAQGVVTRSVVRDNLFNLFIGSLNTTVRWLGNAVVTFLNNPAALAEIVADPSLLPQALEEVLRLETVVQLIPRLVCRDGVELGGVKFRKGQAIFLFPGAANRDPQAFERPLEFDIHRPPKLQLGFGVGIHQCIGMHLARLDTRIFFEILLPVLPQLEVVRLDYGPSWNSWGPEALTVRRQG